MAESRPSLDPSIVFRPGDIQEEVVKAYGEWVKDGKYMKDTGPSRYKGHHVACEDLETFFPDNRDKVKVIDIGAGTGRAGVLLAEKGFKLIDALDPCAGMLDEARKLKIYNKCICEPLGFDRLPIEDNTYDLAIVAGAMGDGHIPCEGLYEMARIVKPGGLISISMKPEFLETCSDYRGRLDPLMEKMEQDGVWKLVSRDIRENVFFGKQGLVYKFLLCQNFK